MSPEPTLPSYPLYALLMPSYVAALRDAAGPQPSRKRLGRDLLPPISTQAASLDRPAA